MAREVDIWWETDRLLKASMRWAHKRGRITFFLSPDSGVSCSKCPFKYHKLCNIWKIGTKNRAFLSNGICSDLWTMKGDNNFKDRNIIKNWQPLGPITREKKDKF